MDHNINLILSLFTVIIWITIILKYQNKMFNSYTVLSPTLRKVMEKFNVLCKHLVYMDDNYSKKVMLCVNEIKTAAKIKMLKLRDNLERKIAIGKIRFELSLKLQNMKVLRLKIDTLSDVKIRLVRAIIHFGKNTNIVKS